MTDLIGYAVSHWGDDPWARGSWSLIGRGGSPDDRSALGAPIGTRLRLAGEATHPSRAGMTHGAYEQGAAAAAWAIGLGHTRVAVVGAGFAGLAAARALAAAGVDVQVWEARDRPGGRAAAADLDGTGFDLGANWLQQYDENVLARLAERLSLRTVPTDFNSPLILPGTSSSSQLPPATGTTGANRPSRPTGTPGSSNPPALTGTASGNDPQSPTGTPGFGRPPAPAGAAGFGSPPVQPGTAGSDRPPIQPGTAGSGRQWDLSGSGGAAPAGPEAIEAELRARLAAAPVGAAIADVLDGWLRDPGPWDPAAVRRFVDAEIVMDSGAPLSWLSARYGFEPGVGEGDRWIVGGYRLLADHLSEGLDIRLHHPVTRIQTDAGGVTLLGDAGSLRADAVIVTVPVGVLAAGAIEFDPPLPDSHRAALSRLGMGRVEKVILRFGRRFWPSHPAGYFRVHGPADTCISEWLDATPADGRPTLVGLFAGNWLDELWSGPDATIAARAATVITNATKPPQPAGRT
jgi:monoamine oxidase